MVCLWSCFPARPERRKPPETRAELLGLQEELKKDVHALCPAGGEASELAAAETSVHSLECQMLPEQFQEAEVAAGAERSCILKELMSLKAKLKDVTESQELRELRRESKECKELQ